MHSRYGCREANLELVKSCCSGRCYLREPRLGVENSFLCVRHDTSGVFRNMTREDLDDVDVISESKETSWCATESGVLEKLKKSGYFALSAPA
jgi:hypothetical protein